MTNSELEGLEERLAKGALDKQQRNELHQEAQSMADLLLLMDKKKDRLKKQAQLEKFHLKMTQEEGVVKTPLKYKLKTFSHHYLMPSAVAAVVSILVVVGSYLTFYYINTIERKQNSNYKSMRRELAQLKAKTKKMEGFYQQVNNGQEQKYYAATGFLIDETGLFVTDYHVIQGATSIVAEKDTMVYDLEVVKAFPELDLVVLRDKSGKALNQKVPFVLDTLPSQLGEPVFSLAFPKEDMVYGEGHIASMSGFDGDSTSYQISIPVNPGSSGAPVLSQEGKLLGVITGKHIQADGAAYAIKSKFLYQCIKEVQADSSLHIPRKISKINRLKKLSRIEQIQAARSCVFQIKVKGT